MESKRSKYETIRNWKRRGVVYGDFEELYYIYMRTLNCSHCNKEFKNSYERCLDHCHNTGKFRNVVCRTCNLNLRKQTSTSITGEQYICIKKNKTYKTGYCYKIQITRFGKKICEKHRSTLEDAIKCRDNFIKENPSLFT